MIRILHFADLHLGVESYGRPDPATGLSSRLGDFLRALDEVGRLPDVGQPTHRTPNHRRRADHGERRLLGRDAPAEGSGSQTYSKPHFHKSFDFPRLG